MNQVLLNDLKCEVLEGDLTPQWLTTEIVLKATVHTEPLLDLSELEERAVLIDKVKRTALRKIYGDLVRELEHLYLLVDRGEKNAALRAIKALGTSLLVGEPVIGLVATVERAEKEKTKSLFGWRKK